MLHVCKLASVLVCKSGYAPQKGKIMCGYCTESNALWDLENNASALDLTHLLSSVMYLQEIDCLNELLERFNQEDLTKRAVTRPVVCRAIEVLIVQGFESAAYQALVQQPQFQLAIAAACEKVAADQAVSDMNPHFQTEKLAWLLEKDTYFVPGCFARHHAETARHMGHGILRSYADWWLEGGSVLKENFDQTMKEEVPGPRQVITWAERGLLENRFPAIWYSLHCLSQSEEDKNLLWRIIQTPLSDTPYFDAFDLWLERRAALAYFDWYGIDPFLDAWPTVRTRLIQYLAAKRVFKKEDRNRVIAKLTGHDDFIDEDFPPSDWHWAGFS